MTKETTTVTEQIKRSKETFRQHQRALPFGEKMRIAFELANRDKTIRCAVLLPKTKNEKS